MNWKTTVLKLIALGEAATGILVGAAPSLAVRALFALDVTPAGILISRVAGIALIGLGVACWPSRSPQQPTYGMLTYGVLVMLYLAAAGIGGNAGLFLWPAVVLHAVLTVFLFFATRREK